MTIRKPSRAQSVARRVSWVLPWSWQKPYLYSNRFHLDSERTLIFSPFSPYVHACRFFDRTHTDACMQQSWCIINDFSVVAVCPGAHGSSTLREVRVVHRLLRADTSSGIVHKHALQKIQAVFAKDLDAIRIDHLIVLFPLPLGETALEVRERGNTRPVGFSRCAENAEDLEDLVDLGITREKRLASSHLGEDAAHGPHVDTSGVLAATKQNLGRAVPEGDNFVSVSAERDTKGASQTKIGQLQVALLVDEQVLRLEIAVQNAVGVAVTGALEELKRELLDL
jgi:hypothetical protein